jgi:uncharacterized protein (TIGR02453 family)
MASGFPGFPKEGLSFFRALEKHNDRDWFQPRKATFDEKLKAPMMELVRALNQEMARYAPDYINEPEKAIYRIYRDTRFSSDKTPYKTHIAAIFPRRGTVKHAGAGLYFAVSHKEVEVAGGVYMPGPEQLLAIRNHIAANSVEFRKILASKKLKTLMGELQGSRLSRVPKGFPCDHEAAELLKYRQWYYYALLDSGVALTPQLLPEVSKRFQALMPLVDFMNRPFTAQKRLTIPVEELIG